ncbi:HAD family phosphatase [Parabacteroides sp. 52]|uniref:HAD family hydrolase n=1 Tax=unclassified Parabacteroides TaxID=2649774 RepID=UPI0013D34266|nr:MULTISPECIES: HAD family phosphatase [unclassified Parabacteroides]MDH6534469.1 beta-phosphoglucomutase [Parabacteroides sp. PM5-20]NDV55081.1 HAD family phosphatase [Parabacteroides sp. 52]
MSERKTALFDFDGVLVDTEPIYDIFWNDAAERYGLGIPHFAEVIKGQTMSHIMKTYFSSYSEAFQQKVRDESSAYESHMPLPLFPGSLEFLQLLKKEGVSIGLVTSSDQCKINRAFQLYDLQGMFDTVVTADRISEGKPNPMCYLLAASDLGVAAENCLVFEDSFAGIQAGNAAGMRVIGLSTTNSAESLQDKVYEVIPDFRQVSFEKYLQW